MLQITRREALRIRGKGAQRREREIVTEAPGGTDDHELERVLNNVDIGRVLASLTPGDRMLVWMRYVEDLTQPGVAERLGIPEGTVKVRLYRLRRRLAERLTTA